MQKLSPKEVQQNLAKLSGWVMEDGALKKKFKFQTFTEAIVFINRLAATAEQLNHHPDWSNSYNKVAISLTSHEAGGLTTKDFDFARAADQAAKAE